MKDKKYYLSTILALELGILMLAAIFVRTFLPALILPKPEIPNFVLVSLVAVLINHYLVKETKPCYLGVAVFSVASFGILPLAASYVSLQEALHCAWIGGIIFTLTTFLFTSFQDRFAVSSAGKLAPIFSALGIYFASQGFIGMIS